MDWKAMLAYITRSVDRELLLRNEYLVTENRILRNQLQGRLAPVESTLHAHCGIDTRTHRFARSRPSVGETVAARR